MKVDLVTPTSVPHPFAARLPAPTPGYLLGYRKDCILGLSSGWLALTPYPAGTEGLPNQAVEFRGLSGTGRNYAVAGMSDLTRFTARARAECYHYLWYNVSTMSRQATNRHIKICHGSGTFGLGFLFSLPSSCSCSLATIS